MEVGGSSMHAEWQQHIPLAPSFEDFPGENGKRKSHRFSLHEEQLPHSVHCKWNNTMTLEDKWIKGQKSISQQGDDISFLTFWILFSFYFMICFLFPVPLPSEIFLMTADFVQTPSVNFHNKIIKLSPVERDRSSGEGTLCHIVSHSWRLEILWKPQLKRQIGLFGNSCKF